MIAQSEQGSSRGRKFLVKAGGGALFGACSTFLFLFLVGDDRLDFASVSVMLSIVAGLTFFLIGIFVAFGVIAPRAGAHVLNVEDADEIRESRRMLAPSATAYALIGVFLLTLALAPVLAGPAGRDLVLMISGASLTGVIVITALTRGRADELVRQISLEASSWTLQIGLVILATWGALAHLDYVAWVEPLALISGVALLFLFTVFVISAQKGLMEPR